MDQGCGSGACGCAGTSGATLTAAQEAGYETLAALVQPVARVNGVALHAAGEALDAEVLRQRVTSKGGTTYAAIQSMEHDAVGEKFVQAMHAARQRAHELGDEFGK